MALSLSLSASPPKRSVRGVRRIVTSSSYDLQYVPKIPWHELDSTEKNLLAELRSMYWAGVKREMAYILLTLREWQQPKYASVVLNDEKDKFVHGFDTFIDQVSQPSRKFAEIIGES
jgi:hypothetical protein